MAKDNDKNRTAPVSDDEPAIKGALESDNAYSSAGLENARQTREAMNRSNSGDQPE
ncbi:hypothetical protein [Bacillus sp. M6-12]|uniref:hypothetical protein n=1 Tax=Bacillus sp. M6-12 TaxID=2054166 RepID=UPI0015E0CB30|nr:hypothetical protein [Bacillus sp. M6-12]